MSARRCETGVDRVQLQGEGKGETAEEKGEEQSHDDWEIQRDRARGEHMHAATGSSKRVLAGVSADVWGSDVVAAAAIISITKREFSP